jgi:hypothetical protein
MYGNVGTTSSRVPGTDLGRPRLGNRVRVAIESTIVERQQVPPRRARHANRSRYFRDHLPHPASNGCASGMKYAFDPCQHFVVLNKIAAFCRAYPALHGCNKLRLPLQIDTQNLLRQSVGIATFAHSNGFELRFLFRSERYFHKSSLGSPQTLCQRDASQQSSSAIEPSSSASPSATSHSHN